MKSRDSIFWVLCAQSILLYFSLARSSEIQSMLRAEAGMEHSKQIKRELTAFHTVSYWDTFYTNETETWDWYSTADWLPDVLCSTLAAISHASKHCGLEDVVQNVISLRLLDVGCGISSLLFDLAVRESPKLRWERLTGIDFCDAAIQVMRSQPTVCGPISGIIPSFQVADASRLEMLSDESFEVVFDKGCLDCFVSSKDHDKIPTFLKEISRVLTPRGLLFILPVCDANIPSVLRSGQVERSSASSAQDNIPGIENARAIFHVHEVLAFHEKHLFVARKQRPTGGHVWLQCIECSSRQPYPPRSWACTCGASLHRFALS